MTVSTKTDDETWRGGQNAQPRSDQALSMNWLVMSLYQHTPGVFFFLSPRSLGVKTWARHSLNILCLDTCVSSMLQCLRHGVAFNTATDAKKRSYILVFPPCIQHRKRTTWGGDGCNFSATTLYESFGRRNLKTHLIRRKNSISYRVAW